MEIKSFKEYIKNHNVLTEDEQSAVANKYLTSFSLNNLGNTPSEIIDNLRIKLEQIKITQQSINDLLYKDYKSSSEDSSILPIKLFPLSLKSIDDELQKWYNENRAKIENYSKNSELMNNMNKRTWMQSSDKLQQNLKNINSIKGEDDLENKESGKEEVEPEIKPEDKKKVNPRIKKKVEQAKEAKDSELPKDWVPIDDVGESLIYDTGLDYILSESINIGELKQRFKSTNSIALGKLDYGAANVINDINSKIKKGTLKGIDGSYFDKIKSSFGSNIAIIINRNENTVLNKIADCEKAIRKYGSGSGRIASAKAHADNLYSLVSSAWASLQYEASLINTLLSRYKTTADSIKNNIDLAIGNQNKNLEDRTEFASNKISRVLDKREKRAEGRKEKKEIKKNKADEFKEQKQKELDDFSAISNGVRNLYEKNVGYSYIKAFSNKILEIVKREPDAELSIEENKYKIFNGKLVKDAAKILYTFYAIKMNKYRDEILSSRKNTEFFIKSIKSKLDDSATRSLLTTIVSQSKPIMPRYKFNELADKEEKGYQDFLPKPKSSKQEKTEIDAQNGRAAKDFDDSEPKSIFDYAIEKARQYK